MTELTSHDRENFAVLQREFQKTLNNYFDRKDNFLSDQQEIVKTLMVVAGSLCFIAGLEAAPLTIIGSALLIGGRILPSETRLAARNATRLYKTIHNMDPERTKFFMEKFGRDGVERGMFDGQFTAFKRRPDQKKYNDHDSFSPL